MPAVDLAPRQQVSFLTDQLQLATPTNLGHVSVGMDGNTGETPGVRSQIGTYAVPFIRGTLASSAVLNAFAFYEGAGTGCVLKGAAIGFGLAIPAGIYALTRIGAALYLNGDQ